VKSFTVDVWKDGKWTEIAVATTIGYKRIVKIDPIQTSRIRVTILDSKACPLISNVEVY
jgi:alpha-L-fucosidase